MHLTIFLPVLNEIDIIESKLEHSLNLGANVVVVEGSIKETYNVGENGLSTDGTTEILKSYGDKIHYLPAGKIPEFDQKGNKINQRALLQNIALDYIRKQLPFTEILHRTDADEFISKESVEMIDRTFREKNYWMVYTDLVNLVDATRYTENVSPQSGVFPFCPDHFLTGGMFHERFYRYRPDLHYEQSAHALSDMFGRQLFAHPDYYFNRGLADCRILHYKYIDGPIKLIKSEMSYIEEDGIKRNQNDLDFIHNSPEILEFAKERLMYIFRNDTHPLQLEDHPKEVRKAKWFKYEPINYDFKSITVDDILK